MRMAEAPAVSVSTICVWEGVPHVPSCADVGKCRWCCCALCRADSGWHRRCVHEGLSGIHTDVDELCSSCYPTITNRASEAGLANEAGQELHFTAPDHSS